MRAVGFFQFRLANLFYFVTVMAILIAAWDFFLRENVGDIWIRDAGIRYRMTDDWYAWMGQPHFHDETGELIDTYNVLGMTETIMVNRPTHGYSWPSIAAFAFAVVAIEVVLHLWLWRSRVGFGISCKNDSD